MNNGNGMLVVIDSSLLIEVDGVEDISMGKLVLWVVVMVWDLFLVSLSILVLGLMKLMFVVVYVVVRFGFFDRNL